MKAKIILVLVASLIGLTEALPPRPPRSDEKMHPDHPSKTSREFSPAPPRISAAKARIVDYLTSSL
jgi:hypothetical protein